MKFWRMQLHPDDPNNAVAHTVRSLGLGYIGLDFSTPPGDLTDVAAKDITQHQRDYWEFAHTMTIGDKVLVIAHHYPLALVTVSGNYNYIRRPEEELGVWFRHFRRVEEIKYYSDWVTNPNQYTQTIMTDTISVLKDQSGVCYNLIKSWP